MTHHHRYLQLLRQQLPAATPFFDIAYHRTTPAEQQIGHLAAQCGENHLAPLRQALSVLLAGLQTAIFLPRHTFAPTATDQVRDHFNMHAKYVRSLHQIPLSPMLINLDTIRTEHSAEGKLIERTT